MTEQARYRYNVFFVAVEDEAYRQNIWFKLIWNIIFDELLFDHYNIFRFSIVAGWECDTNAHEPHL